MSVKYQTCIIFICFHSQRLSLIYLVLRNCAKEREVFFKMTEEEEEGNAQKIPPQYDPGSY